MSVRSLFSIILKVIGILFIRNVLSSISEFLGILIYLRDGSLYEIVLSIFLVLIVLLVHGLSSYLFIFQTDLIIDKLELDKKFEDDVVNFSMHRSTLLSIAIIVLGGIILVEEIPKACNYIILYYRELKYSEDSFKYNSTPLIISGLKIIIGLLLMGSHRIIVNFIERKRIHSITEKNISQ